MIKNLPTVRVLKTSRNQPGASREFSTGQSFIRPSLDTERVVNNQVKLNQLEIDMTRLRRVYPLNTKT